MNIKLNKRKKSEQKPLRTWVKKWYADSITNTVFVWIYADHINWRLHEDQPYKDTIAAETDQTIEDFRINGAPSFIADSAAEIGIEEMYQVIDDALAFSDDKRE